VKQRADCVDPEGDGDGSCILGALRLGDEDGDGGFRSDSGHALNAAVLGNYPLPILRWSYEWSGA